MNEGTIIREETDAGPLLSKLSKGSSVSDAEATIHSHPYKVVKVDGKTYVQWTSQPFSTDMRTFRNYSINNIVIGFIGAIPPHTSNIYQN